jgi:hypothetical protein
MKEVKMSDYEILKNNVGLKIHADIIEDGISDIGEEYI